VGLCHLFLKERVRPGDRVVDATCGNGHDTLLLARLAGPTGKVWGFDIQEAALTATRKLLADEGCLDRVELCMAGHERLGEFATPPLNAVVFNLGYLPGGDKSRITRPETTLAALEASLGMLADKGLLLVVVYPGHPGGDNESDALQAWGAGLPPEQFNVWCSRQQNRLQTSPYLILVERGNR
jgi:SAM-dependent methyltransferase